MSDVQAAAVKARWHVPVGWGITLMVCLVIGVSFLWLLHSGQNYQESFNVALANHVGGDIASQVSADDPMPLYYLFIRGLSHLFAPTIMTLRLVSLVFYLLMLPVAYLVGRRATNEHRVGILAVALIGLSPFMVWYGNRATMYVLLALMVLVNQYFFEGILQQKAWQWPGYALSGLLGLGIHYFFVIVLATQLLFLLIKLRQLPRATIYVMLASCFIFAVAFMLWLQYSLAHGVAWSHLPYTSKPSATNAFIILAQFLFGFQSVVTTTFVIAFWPLLVVLALLAVQKYIRPPIGVQYFTFAAFFPIFVVFVLSWAWRGLFLSSYLIVCVPPFLLLLSWYLVAFELKALVWTRYILIAVMVGMLFIELTNPQRAISGDYLGALTTPGRNYQPASSPRVSAYAGHHVPAAGPPLQVPSDSPGVLTQRK